MNRNRISFVNLLISLIVIVGFITTSVISYQSNMGLYRDNVEHMATLASDGLYYKLQSMIEKPLHVAVTMSNGRFLKDFLQEGNKTTDLKERDQKLVEYLNTYKEKYGYDTLFMVSERDGRYYHYDGLTRNVSPKQQADDWYYQLLEDKEEYTLKMDEDSADNGKRMVFINCKIQDDGGQILGAVGVGIDVQDMQSLLVQYSANFDVSVFLTDPSGQIQMSYTEVHPVGKSLSEIPIFSDLLGLLTTTNGDQQKAWYDVEGQDGHISARYLEELGWNLVVAKNTDPMKKIFFEQMLKMVIVILLILVVIIFLISKLVRYYHSKILALTVSQELEYARLLQDTTEKLYESVLEINVTENRAMGTELPKMYQRHGIPMSTPYEEALTIIARKEIRPDFVAGYLTAFGRQAVLDAYDAGVTNLNYDFLSMGEQGTYEWVRVSAQMFFWRSDHSLHMISYRRNIDEEKRRELDLIEKSQKDGLTGLYNKRAAEEQMMECLATPGKHAFILVDVDNFKSVNDDYGHTCGDSLLQELANELKANFHASDIIGRIGGDEFIIMMRNFGDVEVVRKKLVQLCERVRIKRAQDKTAARVSFSIGVAQAPEQGTTYSELYEKADQAMYYAKRHGKDNFIFYGEAAASNTSHHVSQRDLDELLNNSSDGIVKIACGEPTRLLYFNQKRVDLTGTPREVLMAEDYVPLMQVHPDDRQSVCDTIQKALNSEQNFVSFYRLQCVDGHYVRVRLKGNFAKERYNGLDPVFYGVYEIVEPAE